MLISALVPILLLLADDRTATAARPFVPADDVGLTLFKDVWRGGAGGIVKYSPNGRYLAVLTERGRLDLNAPEDAIWVFRIEDVQRFLQHPKMKPPLGMPLVQVSTDKDGPLIEHVRWLPDSSGIAFTAVEKSSCCKFRQLFLADIASHSVKALTPQDQDVADFDIRSLTAYVYEVNAPSLLLPPEDKQPAQVLTGSSFWSVVFQNNQLTPFHAAGLWAVIDSRRRLVLDGSSYAASPDGANLSLSPDGRSVVATLKVEHPPQTTWTRYQAPPGYRKYFDASAYYMIDLTRGTKNLLVNAPSGVNNDWHTYLLRASWSADGQSLLLPDTFFPLDVTDPKEVAEREKHPYIAVLRLKSGEVTPVLPVRAGSDPKRYAIQDARFENDRTVVVNFDRTIYLHDQPPSAIFGQQTNGTWRQLPGTEDPRLSRWSVRVYKRESVDQPPQLIAEDRRSSVTQILWDPNPQLRAIERGPAEIIKWKDDSGHQWKAGMLLPPDYMPEKRYPLVIQTHGFSENQFLSSGFFPTAFAARALAARGFVVLQMGVNPTDTDTPQEGRDQVRGFESVVKKLAADGLIDPGRVGAIGFSRTVYHVIFAMTAAKSLFAATSITDGVNFGLFEYITRVDSGIDWDADRINGGKPFGAEGMKNWAARSPEFNMDKVQTPLLLLQPGLVSVIEDWEPYAALRYLKKPVDLIMLQPGTHVMTNPTQRLASETLNVDWFSFWLQGYEDPDPAKREQYDRWEHLCDLQRTENPTRPAFCVGTRSH